MSGSKATKAQNGGQAQGLKRQSTGGQEDDYDAATSEEGLSALEEIQKEKIHLAQ